MAKPHLTQMAIASSVFQFIVKEIGCKALFITHYPLIAEDAERSFPMQMENIHMKSIQTAEMDRRLSVHFLYTLTPGISAGSFGVECARLAGLPENVLQSAAKQSTALQTVINSRIKATRSVVVISENLNCSYNEQSPQRIKAAETNDNARFFN